MVVICYACQIYKVPSASASTQPPRAVNRRHSDVHRIDHAVPCIDASLHAHVAKRLDPPACFRPSLFQVSRSPGPVPQEIKLTVPSMMTGEL